MNNYLHDSLYSDLLGFSSVDNLKGKPEEVNYSMDNRYREPMNNVMTEDGIYSSMGMGAAPINYNSPSPMMSYQDSAAPMMDYTNISSNQDFESNLGPFPQDLTDVMNSLLIDASKDFAVNEFDNLDIDVAAAVWQDNDDTLEDDLRLFGNVAPVNASGYGTETHLLQTINCSALQEPVRRRKPKKVNNSAPSVDEASTITSPAHLGYDSYLGVPSPASLGVPSPASSSSYSDAGSSNEETHKPRQRRPRVSYDTLTEEEKYQRIRDLNNEASRHYRQRQRNTFTQLEQELPSLIEKNQHLKDKAAALEKLRDQMKQYSNAFLKQHMSNTNVSGF